MIVLCLQFVLLATTFKFYRCYPNGAPESVCDNLVPSLSMHGKPPQTSWSPFEFRLRKYKRSFQAIVEITIESYDNSTFRGFAIQARPENGSVGAIGFFRSENNDSRTINCFGSKDSAITHSDNKDKHSVTVIWTAPDPCDSIEVVFFYTIVKTKEVFWTNLDYRVIVLGLSRACEKFHNSSGSIDSSGSSGDHSNQNRTTNSISKYLPSYALNISFNMSLILSLVSVLVLYIH